MVHSTAVGGFRLSGGAGKVLGMAKHKQHKNKIVLDLNEVKRLRDCGISLTEIAEQLGTTPYVVTKRCMENGIVYGKGNSPANKRANHDPSRKKEGYKPHGGKSHRRRARKFGVEYDSSITWKSLSRELGHLNCQICGEPCGPNDKSWNGYFGPLYPTVDCIVAMKNGGGYILSPSHDYLLEMTPVENVLAMYDTCYELGAY